MSSIRDAQRLAALEARVAVLEARLAELSAPRLDLGKLRAGGGLHPGRGNAVRTRTGRKERQRHG